jgi:hypothetical protein
MIYSDQLTMTIGISFIIVFFYYHIIFRTTTILKVKYWRQQMPLAITVNAIGFSSIALFFYHYYGCIVDDTTYFKHSLAFNGNFFSVNNGTAFMFLITRPLRQYLDFDLPSCHALFFVIGLIGSLNYLYVLSNRIDFNIPSHKVDNLLKFWTMLCFPNFMAWGRIFGKDALMLFFSSFCVLLAYNILEKKRHLLLNLLFFSLIIVTISKIRVHIAIALTLSLFVGLYFVSVEKRRYFTFNQNILMKILAPTIITVAFIIITPILLKKATQQETLSVETIKEKLVYVKEMGSSGGSATSLASEIHEDPNSAMTPKKIGLNILNLIFAPLPWQVRGAQDMVALVSNIFLLFLILNYIKRVDLSGVFQKYLLMNIILFVAILSFMTGNVGLILRQKTIFLPFIFLLLFRSRERLQVHRPARYRTVAGK